MPKRYGGGRKDGSACYLPWGPTLLVLQIQLTPIPIQQLSNKLMVKTFDSHLTGPGIKTLLCGCLCRPILEKATSGVLWENILRRPHYDRVRVSSKSPLGVDDGPRSTWGRRLWQGGKEWGIPLAFDISFGLGNFTNTPGPLELHHFALTFSDPFLLSVICVCSPAWAWHPVSILEAWELYRWIFG